MSIRLPFRERSPWRVLKLEMDPWSLDPGVAQKRWELKAFWLGWGGDGEAWGEQTSVWKTTNDDKAEIYCTGTLGMRFVCDISDEYIKIVDELIVEGSCQHAVSCCSFNSAVMLLICFSRKFLLMQQKGFWIFSVIQFVSVHLLFWNKYCKAWTQTCSKLELQHTCLHVFK